MNYKINNFQKKQICLKQIFNYDMNKHANGIIIFKMEQS